MMICRNHLYTFIPFFFIIHYASCELPSIQVTAINNLYHQLLKSNNNNTSEWNASTNPCSWPRVSCNSDNSSITMLSLSSLSISNDVNSSWSSLVCGLKTLKYIDLANNQLTSIPAPFLSSSSCGGGLKVLNFSNNRLSGTLDTFQGSLEVLDLSHNLFNSVTIDSQFSGLNELLSLNISHNNFSGSIPTKLGKSMLLQELQLSDNLFKGIFSNEITKYYNLSLLDFSVNRLVGKIPSGISELSKLQILVLSANKLVGEIPQSISTMTSLKRFAANQNNFTGSIPQGITRYLSNLDLSYNLLIGSIPSDLLSQPNLLTVDLTSNRLEGSIPSNMSMNLVRLRLGGNQLRGQIPSWSFGNDVVPSLTYLEVDNNNLGGVIPFKLSLYKSLSLLDLSHNNLVGSIPPELGELNRLQVLQLQNNNLFGEIPNEVGNLQMLEKLNVSWNSLSGSLPSSLSQLHKLTNLDLQVNNLTGEIPDSFGDMSSLLELQLGNNKLGGFIKSLPIYLQISLNLSHNNFVGSIPSSLFNLKALEVLDLSNNKFSGHVPSFLLQMRSLTTILLNYNLLTGLVPKFGSNVVVSTEGNNVTYGIPNSFTPGSPNIKRPVFVGIIVASIAAVTLMIAVVVALIVSRRTDKVNTEEPKLSQSQVIKSHLLTLNVIHRTNLDFTNSMEAVGHPSSIVLKTRFSAYYKAVMPSGKSYFVKKVNWSDKMFQLGSHDLFEQELEIVGRLRNSSIMIPLAYALTTDSAYLLYEYSEKGNLFDALHGSLASDLDWTNRYSIAIGIANGLAFLHQIPSAPIILLDLSSKAIMLKSLNEPLIGDIELSKVIDPSKSTGNLSALAGSVGYVPPEYAYTMRVTMAGNVYSFGVILLELLAGKAAVSEGYELAKWVSTKLDNLDHILDPTVSRTSPAARGMMLVVLKVALACVNISPQARPKMKSVLRMLLNARN